MRKIFAFVIISFLITSCDKKETEPETTGNKEFRIHKVIYSEHYQKYAYDSMGRVSETSIHFNNDTLNIFYFYYFYNENNQLIQILSKNKTVDMHQYNLTFTDSSIIEIISENQNENWIESYKNEYFYGENKKCIKKKFFDTNLSTPSYYYKYTWENGNIVKEEEISYASGLLYTKNYEYDNTINPFYPISLDNRTIPHFQNNNNPIAYQKTSVWGDNFDPATYTYTLNEYGYIDGVNFTNEYGEETAYLIEYEEIK